MSLTPPVLVAPAARRAVALLLLLSLSSTKLLAAPEASVTAYNSVGGIKQEILHKLATTDFGASIFSLDSIKAWLKKLGKKQQALDRIAISPTNGDGTLTVMQGERVVFSATGYAGEDAIGGIDFKWSAQDAERKRPARNLIAGVFEAGRPGVYTVTASSGDGQQASVTVNVYFDEGYGLQRLLQKKDADRTDKEKQGIAAMLEKGYLVSRDISSKKLYDAESERQLYEIDKLKREAAREKQIERRQEYPNPLGPVGSTSSGGSITDKNGLDRAVSQADVQRRKGGPSADDGDGAGLPEPAPETSGKKAPSLLRPADEDGWDGTNWSTADDPVNQVGTPAGAAPDAGAGNGDYQINAPVLSLAGRGIDINLALVYNSRLWSKSGTKLSYDSDKGWPAPGWNLGFGKMMYMGTGGCMIVTPDGTRRSYTGTNYTYSSGSNYSTSYWGYTTDGSFTDLFCRYSSSTYGKTLNGSATLPNGTVISYSSPTGVYDQMFPTQITDAQGNYVTITYVNNQGPNINTISDTLGRTITFNYDASNRLISVTGPGYNGTTRTFVRLHYTALTLSYAFASGYTTDVAGTNTKYVLDSIYYPDTNTGYWFGDSDSYSSYGMIAKVIQQRGMGWSGTAGTQGTVTQGTMTDQKAYNFTLTPLSTLTDSPYYTTMTENWAGMDTAAAVTGYAVSSTSTDQVITVTMADGSVNKQTSHIAAGTNMDGMYYQGEVYASASAPTPLTKTKTILGNGDYGTTRPTRVEVTDELGNLTATDFLYAASSYNQLITQKEYGYGGTALYRQTNNTYYNDSAYTDRHIFNLLKSTETVNPTGVRLNRTEYQYDNNAVVNGTSNPNLAAATGVVHHNDTSDPFTANTHEEEGSCILWYPEGTGCTYNGQKTYDPDTQETAWCLCEDYDVVMVSNYDPDTIFRGNVTKVTTYSSASDLTGAVSYDYTYDITGNQRTATTNCCQQMSFGYTANTQFSQPETHTKGSSDPNSPLRMTESATYDFNTGVTKTSTDFNGRTTTTTYDAALRPTLVTLPTGGKTSVSYDDANLTSTQTVQLYDNTVVSESSSTLNGRGQPVYSKYLAGATNWNASSVKYDAMGRKWQASLPYDSAGSPSQWTVYAYDALSRVTQVTAPDGSTSKTFYNETGARPDSASASAGQTVRTQDAWGRERWARTDDFGRLAEVVEPNPTGNGTVAAAGSLQTSYSYDQLDQLTTVTQGSQTRRAKYDSLGRVIRQKLAEQTATINDAGTYVGAGGTGALWSDAFAYDTRSNITQRTDARGVKANFSYLMSGNTDPLNRLQSISYDTSSADTTYTINAAPSVTLSYMTTGDQTRVASVTTAGVATETNGYDTEGRISDYTLTLTSRSSYPMQTSYTYDTANRLTQITYPAQYGIAGSPRKTVTPSYDQASRLTQMAVNGQTQLSGLQYNTFGQVTSLTTGNPTGTTDTTEQYGYDSATGLLTSQSVTRTSDSQQLLNLSYGYTRGNSNGNLTGKSGQLTQITNGLDGNKDRSFEFDALGRLKAAKGGLAAGATGVTANWSQSYTYDRYGNKTAVSSAGVTADSNAVPTDGIPSLTYDQPSNRINTSGYTYDNAGNMIRGQSAAGTWVNFEYDAAGRLVKVLDDAAPTHNVLETYTYGADRSRLSNTASGQTTYYAWGGTSVIQEYTEATGTTAPVYSKAYVYAGSRLLSTATNISGSELVEFHHPDRLGTKVVTAPSATPTSYEQSTLPFGAELAGEESGTISTNQQFTSYDRSNSTGLDYAVNRTYSSGQGRFTQVDPAGEGLNLYAYVGNNPVDFVDPSGLNLQPPWGGGGFGELLFRWASNMWDSDGFSAEYSGSDHFAIGSGIEYSGGDYGDLLNGPPLLPGIHTTGHWGENGWVIDGFVVVGNHPEAPNSDEPGGGGGNSTNNDCNDALLVTLARDVKVKWGKNARHMFSPTFASKFSAALRELNAQGIVPKINSDFRTSADQERMRKGASGKNPAAAGISMHQTGNAVDIDGTRTPQFVAIRKAMAGQGFSWGHSYGDNPHFDLNPYGKGTKGYDERKQGAADAAENYYNTRTESCWSH